MPFLEILLIAISLGMDAFAVAICVGSSLITIRGRQVFRLSFHFGLFQFLMPLIGWLVGSQFAYWIADFDHWAAFGLLSAVGLKMIVESRKAEDGGIRGDATRGISLVMLSIATSIDALALGLSLAFLQTSIVWPSIVIGITAAAMTAPGMFLGKRISQLVGKKMELVGGLLLIGIAVKILAAHP